MSSSSERWAVVTGASSGIGAATARALADEGWRLILVARRRDPLEQLASEVEVETRVEPLDAADGDAVLALAARTLEEGIHPELLVNSAGAGVWRFIEETPPDAAREMMGAPFFAAYHLVHAFVPSMLERRRGLIVHVGSPASILPWPGATAYSCSRWALRGLHESLCQDLVGTGIQSCHVIFGWVSSSYFENNPGSRETAPSIARLVPSISPEQCARVILETVSRPRRTVVHPFMLRFFYTLYHLAPRLVRWLLARTGRRHG